MPFTLKKKQMDNYLHIEAEGSISGLEELIEYAEAIIGEKEKANLLHSLADERNISVDLSYHDLVAFADTLSAKAYHLKGHRVATIHAPRENPVQKLYEPPASNRGHSYRTFASEKEALDWLLRPDPDQ